jgi:hypothetical protein
MTYRIDVDEVRRGLDLLAPPVFELRCLNTVLHGERRAATFSGYFDRDHIDAAIDALGQIQHASGCYFTPHEVQPELLARAYNRARIVPDKEPTTADKDIISRRWLLIDVDVVRPKNISSTEDQKQLAIKLATAIDCWLWERKFPPGILGDSGNGAHLMIPLRPELPADDGGRSERLLKLLAREFDTPHVMVDKTTFNPSRIWKLPGTEVRKGDNCPEIGREWRVSRIIQVCNEVTEDAARS